MKLMDLGITEGEQIDLNDITMSDTLKPVQVDVTRNNEITLANEEYVQDYIETERSEEVWK